MPRLRLENPTDVIDLDGSAVFAALAGVSGAGLPDVSTQWIEGAGDGAQYRGERVLSRDLDLPVFIRANSRQELSTAVSRLALMLAGLCTLRFIEDDGTSWSLDVRRVGGGSASLGLDTDAVSWLSTVVTVRAGNPFWTASASTRRDIVASAGRGLLRPGGLFALRLSGSQTLGTVLMENTGNASAYPLWTVTGPGSGLVATAASGESFTWEGTLADGETLVVDTRTASVVDGTGASRYAELGPAPKLWRIPPGVTSANVALADTSSDSRISVEWFARKWTVV